ncbi:MAG: Ig-like domain-containing protein [Capnocytophaga felis]|nr:Ig-like domain-containing protein [Capnocytophaga felis]
MKKNVLWILCGLFLAFVSCSTKEEDMPIVAEKTPIVNLSETSPVKLIEGESKEVIISGEHIDKFEVKSSNTEVATINVNVKAKTFIIEAKTSGIATITVSSKNVSKVLEVEVSSKNVLVERITFGEQLKFPIGKTHRLEFTVFPENATNKKLIWSSDNTKVVRVNQDGTFHVSIVENGKATITAKSTDGSNVSAEITILAVNPIKQIQINLGESHTMAVGSELKLGYELTALTTKFAPTDETLSWKSSSPEIVSVTNEGKIRCLQEGEAQITATANDGFGAESNIIIKSITPVSRIELNNLGKGQALSVKNRSRTNLTVSTFFENNLVETIEKGKSKNPFVSVRFFKRNESQNYMAEIKDDVLSVHKTGTFVLGAVYTHSLIPNEEVTCEITVTVTD